MFNAAAADALDQCGREVHEDTCLPLIGPVGKYGGLSVLLSKASAGYDSWPFSGNPEVDLAREFLTLGSA